MLMRVLRYGAIGVAVLGVTAAILYQFFGLRIVILGGGTPTLAFVTSQEEQAELVEQHRGAQGGAQQGAGQGAQEGAAALGSAPPIALSTAPSGKDGQPDQPLAAAARDRLRSLVQGRQVRLLFEDESRDRYGRWRAHLDFDDGTSAEDILIKEGLAWVVAIPPNIARLARHRQAETTARSARRGLWAQAGYAPVPAESLTATETGFRFVRGRVTHVGRSRKFVYLDMGPRFALRIGHHDWERPFQGDPGQWRGALLEARGWVSEYQGRLHLSIGHPAMLERP